MEALDFETEPPQKVASAWLRTTGVLLTRSPDAQGEPALRVLKI